MESNERIETTEKAAEDGKRTVRVSVRALVEFILRSGDLNGSRGGWADREAMLAGSRIHRKIQKRRGSGYTAEVRLSFSRVYPELILVVEGRADGIFAGENPEIEEIKGVYADIDKMEAPVPVHLAQAKCYAYIYARDKGLDSISVCMTYANLETGHERQFRETFSTEELGAWFDALLESYRKWAEFRIHWEEKRDASMQGLEFPFPYRKGQREMVVDVYRTILRRKQMFVQAPTGVGKTMSAVFPAVRAIGEKKAGRIFYLTAKTIARSVAEQAFSILRGKGLSLKSLTLTAKEKICPLEECVCTPENCPRAKGHFDRINDALYELLTQEDCFTRERIQARAEKRNVCPHELQLDLSDFADAVICDYNYVFDPNAKLKRFFGEGAPKGDTVFLIDEAHNLVERGREMYSADLKKQEFLDALRTVRKLRKEDAAESRMPVDGLRKELEKLSKSLNTCSRLLLALRRTISSCEEIPYPDDLANALLGLTGRLEDVLSDLPEGEARQELLGFYFRVTDFTGISELLDENYLIYAVPLSETDMEIRLFCVDPSVNLQRSLDMGAAAVFFSATLLPVRYYENLLTTKTDSYAVYIDSPFDVSRSLVAVGRDVSSRYRQRNADGFRKMAAYIREVTAQKAGNYMAFFPSYALMESVVDVYQEEYRTEDVTCLMQHTGMDESEREAFLDRFREKTDGTLIGFCVMGGIFSEGIDLAGERLIGAIVIGTGLPQVSEERELLKSYYDRKGMSGFDYAYRFPGMNKVLQASGRVIRTTEDRGVIVLLDDRFARTDYAQLFPREWKNRKYVTLATIAAELREFWRNQQNCDILETDL